MIIYYKTNGTWCQNLDTNNVLGVGTELIKVDIGLANSTPATLYIPRNMNFREFLNSEYYGKLNNITNQSWSEVSGTGYIGVYLSFFHPSFDAPISGTLNPVGASMTIGNGTTVPNPNELVANYENSHLFLGTVTGIASPVTPTPTPTPTT